MEVNNIKIPKKILKKLRESSKKYAYPSGSYEELKGVIRDSIQEKLIPNQHAYIPATYPDHVIVNIYTENPITYEASEEYFKVPYSVDDQGIITLGEFKPAKELRLFESIKSAIFVSKDDAKRLVTGPVAIPDYDDCDACRGEKQLTVDEIETMAHEFNLYHQKSDEMHLFGVKGELIGDVVESWTLKQEMTLENINGDKVTLPVGTWMATIKVTSDEVWKKIEDGTYRGFSATYLSKSDAEELAAAKIAGKRVLIKDLEDPVPVTISIVDKPCVYDAIFTSVKQEDQAGAVKAGRRFSDTVFSKLKDVKNFIDGLVNEAENERQSQTDTSGKMEELDMDEKELRAIFKDEVGKAVEPIKQEVESIKGRLPLEEEESKKEEPDEESEKKAPDGKESEKKEPEIPEEVQKQLKDMEKENQSLKKKLGLPVEKTSLEGQSDEEEATKEEPESDRDAWGCKIRD